MNSRWKTVWVCTIFLNIFQRVRFIDIAPWIQDSVAVVWKAMKFRYDSVFPNTGIGSSVGVPQFNGDIWVTYFCSFIPGGLMGVTLVLTLLQIPVTLMLIFALKGFSRINQWLLGSALLFNPFLIGCGANWWPTYKGMMLIHLIVLGWLHLQKNGKAGPLFWFCFSFAIAFAPLYYMGYLTVFIVSLLLGLWALKTKIVTVDGKALAAMALAALLLTVTSVLPYFQERDLSDLLIENPGSGVQQVSLLPGYFWELIFYPRHFFMLSDSNLMNEATNTGLLGSFRSLLILQMALIAWAFVGLCLHYKKNKSFQKLYELISTPHAYYKFILIFFVLAHFLYLVLPSRVYITVHQATAFMMLGQLLWLIPVLRITENGGAQFIRVTQVLALLLLVNCVILNERVVYDNLDYKGQFLPTNLEAPLRDRSLAVSYIAKELGDQKSVGVAYYFRYGNFKKLLDEFDYYIKNRRISADLLLEGRFYDSELLFRYQIRNRNPYKRERSRGDNRFLITFSIVPPNELPAPWTNARHFKEFGRLRVYSKEKIKEINN